MTQILSTRSQDIGFALYQQVSIRQLIYEFDIYGFINQAETLIKPDKKKGGRHIEKWVMYSDHRLFGSPFSISSLEEKCPKKDFIPW